MFGTGLAIGVSPVFFRSLWDAFPFPELILANYKGDSIFLSNKNYLRDYSQKGLHAPVKSPVAYFNGIDNHLKYTSPEAPGLSSFTIALWVKTTDTGVGSIYDFYNSSSSGVVLYKQSGANQPLTVVFRSVPEGGGSRVIAFYGTTIINDGAWHCIIVTFDRSGSITLYVDGDEDETYDISDRTTDTLSQTNPIQIGQKTGPPYDLVDMSAFNVLYEKRILTDREIASFANNNYNPKTALVFSPLCEYGGTLEEDSTVSLVKETDAQGTEGKYVAFDLFVQATETTEIEILNTSNVTAAEVDGATLSDTGLKRSVRVGFLNKGNDATNTPATAMALNETVEQTIWEPNADQHTTKAIGLGTANGVIPSYLGAYAAGSNVAVTNSSYFENVLGTLVSTNEDQSVGFPDTTILTVQPGITKVRIYIWIEGQDVDCENSVTLGSGVSVKLNLNAK